MNTSLVDASYISTAETEGEEGSGFNLNLCCGDCYKYSTEPLHALKLLAIKITTCLTNSKVVVHNDQEMKIAYQIPNFPSQIS